MSSVAVEQNSIQPKTDLTSTAIASLGWKAEQIDVIKRSVAKDATPAELYQFLYLSKEYGLDPFKREIYFMKSGGSPSIITGIDGFRRSAKRDPAYEGVQAFAVKEGDEFEIDPTNYSVKHKFGMKRGKVVGAWARADAKGRRPVIVWVDFDEFNKKQMNWNTMPGVMIAKVAESHAIRRQFGLAGLYTKEEMGVADAQPVAQVIDTSYVVHDVAATDLRDDPFTPDAPVAPAEEAPPQQEENPAPKPNGSSKWKGTLASAHNMGFSEEKVLEEARKFFNRADAASLDDILTTPRDMTEFVLYLKSTKQQ
jgi:phage recombination protein Bet